MNTTLSVIESPRPIVPPLKVTLPVKVVAPPTLRSAVILTSVNVAATPIISVMIPTVILANSISPFSESIVVIVAAVPTISVMIPAVILTSLRSPVSVANTVMVA